MKETVPRDRSSDPRAAKQQMICSAPATGTSHLACQGFRPFDLHQFVTRLGVVITGPTVHVISRPYGTHHPFVVANIDLVVCRRGGNDFRCSGTGAALGIGSVAVGSRIAIIIRCGTARLRQPYTLPPLEPISVYSEALDLSRFHAPKYQENFRRYLEEKYRDKDLGVVVAVGPRALEFMLRIRSEQWSTVPLVFSTVDEATIAKLKLPADVTGTTMQLTLRDMVAIARALVPKLQQVALVGEPWTGTSIYRNFKDELPQLAELEFIDLTGLSVAEIKKRVAVLPENTAILYTAIFVDGAGIAFAPTIALEAIASAANRPIVVNTETQLGHGECRWSDYQTQSNR